MAETCACAGALRGVSRERREGGGLLLGDEIWKVAIHMNVALRT